MKELLAVLIACALCGLAWNRVTKQAQQDGRGWFVRNWLGGMVGVVVFAVVIAAETKLGLLKSSATQAATTNATTTQGPAETASAAPVVADVPPAPTPAAVPEASEDEEEPQKTLNFTHKQYAQRLAAELARLDKKYKLNNAEFSRGEVNDVWSASVNKNFAVLAIVSKETGQVSRVTAIASGDGTPASGLQGMILATAMLTAATEDVPYRKIFKELSSLLDGQSQIHGDVKISATKTNGMGVWFYVEPI